MDILFLLGLMRGLFWLGAITITWLGLMKDLFWLGAIVLTIKGGRRLLVLPGQDLWFHRFSILLDENCQSCDIEI